MRKKWKYYIDRMLTFALIGILLPLFVTIICQRMRLEEVIYGTYDAMTEAAEREGGEELEEQLPLILANVIVGGLFAFSFSMLEVSDSLILAQKAEFYPITRAIYELSQILGSGPFIACAFGVWAMLFLAATLAAAGAILGRKIGSIFKL